MLKMSRVNSDCIQLAELLEVAAYDITNDQSLSMIYDRKFGEENKLQDAFLCSDKSDVQWDALVFHAAIQHSFHL